MHTTTLLANPVDHLVAFQPDEPVHYFADARLKARAAEFLGGFPGMVTYAVKANPEPSVIMHLAAAGLRGFDVASPAEIKLIRSLAPDAAMHYNNPARSDRETEFALDMGVRTFAVDSAEGLDKLIRHARGAALEVFVRFALPVKGGAYDFGSKFGATPDEAVVLLQRAAAAGLLTSLTFHPGTQCADPSAFVAYIEKSAEIAGRAGVTLFRLNVGGGFPAARNAEVPAMPVFFDAIRAAVAAYFDEAPQLVCEPGRAMVAEAYALAARVKALKGGSFVYLNDGIYGGLSEFPILNLTDYRVFAASGREKTDRSTERHLFGPTCDSLDHLPGPVAMPADLEDGDYILFRTMGAYVNGVSTQFNGYGDRETVLVRNL